MGITLNKVTYRYNPEDNTNNEYGIFDISMKVEMGTTVGIIGHTGSGKSTLMQHLNALYLPQSGSMNIDGIEVRPDSKNLLPLRKKVGMVFQYPEDQLFEESIHQDVAFGPKNLGVTGVALEETIRSALEDLGLNYEEFKDRSPYELSGGQKRKVAIASVIAMNPEILVLDEPTAGLDPKSKSELLRLLFDMKEKRHLTVFFVSHNMDDIFLFSDYVYVLNEGRIALEGTPKMVFGERDQLLALGLGVPFTVEVLELLKEKGVYEGSLEPITLSELASILLELKGVDA